MQWFPTTALETTSASQHSLSALRKKTNFGLNFGLFFKIRELLNRPWWPSGLECVSNSSRRSLKDPGSNPAWVQLMEKILTKKELWSRSYVHGRV